MPQFIPTTAMPATGPVPISHPVGTRELWHSPAKHGRKLGRIAIRRPGQPPLAFLDRPEWLRAWFPTDHAEILALCRRLNALLEPPA